MASADLKDELECSVCLNIYTDPVMLRCGHNFCKVCIDRVLDTQGGSGGYSCPECRQKYEERPEPQRNMKLRNIVDRLLSAQPHLEESGVFCTYCVESLVPAVKSCLMCEASLCDKHLKVHSKSQEHVLCEPIANPQNRKCPIHKEVFKYYCTEDAVCICMSCCLIGEHNGHRKVSLDEASNTKKNMLRSALANLLTNRVETEKKIQNLLTQRKKVEKNASENIEKITVLFRDLKRQLEDLQKKVLNEISGQTEKIARSVNDMIQELEMEKEVLISKMHHIEELCNIMDPLTVLQESDTVDLSDTGNGDDKVGHNLYKNIWTERENQLLHDEGGQYVDMISHTLHTLSDIVSVVNKGVYIKENTKILLDVDTAHNRLVISDDRKAVTCSKMQSIPDTPNRFKDHAQVMSSQNISSGQHYWEVNASGSHSWRVGMCYPSIDRREKKSQLGHNEKSWVLQRNKDQYAVIHDGNKVMLLDNSVSNRIRIYLDYDAGKISFYSLSHPIQHLYTFTATFTEPLHAVIGILDRDFCVGTLGSGRICVM